MEDIENVDYAAQVEHNEYDINSCAYRCAIYGEKCIGFGYDKSAFDSFRDSSKPEPENILRNKTITWLEEVMEHTQAHYRHPSLGTNIIFNVSLFKFNMHYFLIR